jgi:hypothetical protein
MKDDIALAALDRAGKITAHCLDEIASASQYYAV